MEFPELGKQCAFDNCDRLDFLPIECSFCHLIFCKDHAEVSRHNCNSVVDQTVTEMKTFTGFKCSVDDCKTKDAVEMPCVKCKKHYCLAHRHHDCQKPSTKKDKRIPRQEFRKAKAETDAIVHEKLRTAKDRTLANKIKLMKIKGSAVGMKYIPSTDRFYLLVAPPLGSSISSKAIPLFVDKTWLLGKTIDFISNKLSATNTNNSLSGPLLRLFNCEGKLVSQELNVTLETLMADGMLIDGDSLILEYITREQMSDNTNIFVGERLNKYTFI